MSFDFLPMLPHDYQWYNGLVLTRPQTDEYNRLTSLINESINESQRQSRIDIRHRWLTGYLLAHGESIELAKTAVAVTAAGEVQFNARSGCVTDVYLRDPESAESHMLTSIGRFDVREWMDIYMEGEVDGQVALQDMGYWAGQYVHPDWSHRYAVHWAQLSYDPELDDTWLQQAIRYTCQRTGSQQVLVGDYLDQIESDPQAYGAFLSPKSMVAGFRLQMSMEESGDIPAVGDQDIWAAIVDGVSPFEHLEYLHSLQRSQRRAGAGWR